MDNQEALAAKVAGDKIALATIKDLSVLSFKGNKADTEYGINALTKIANNRNLSNDIQWQAERVRAMLVMRLNNHLMINHIG